MAVAGRKPKPYLQAVREGNPGQRQIEPGMTLPPSHLVEPRWNDFFPGNKRSMRRNRDTAGKLWKKLATVLERSAGLTFEQQEILVDYCVTYARILEGEHEISLKGMIVETERGQVKNAWTAPLNQYRAHFRSLVGELGLSPAAATRITRRPEDEGSSPFD